MKKLVIAAVAAAALVSSSAAFAGYWIGPVYYPTCGWTPWGYFCG